MYGRYVTFREVITQASQSSEYDTAITEWELGKTIVPHEDHCICGAPITNNFHVYNPLTECDLIVGMECITKFNNIEMTNAAKLQLKALKPNENGKRLCHSCCRYAVTGESFRTFCETCYKDEIRDPSPLYLSAFGVPCGECNGLYIKMSETTTVCRSCYLKRKAASSTTCENCREEPTLDGKRFCSGCARLLSRMCEKCKVPKISANFPEFIKLCDECGTRDCDVCGESYRAFWSKATVCGKCRESEMEFARDCFQCGLPKIAPSEPDTVTHCKACAATVGRRVCKLCKEPKISANARAKVVHCDDCLETAARKKGIVPVKCPHCPTMIPARDVHWRKTCGPCYYKSVGK